MGIEVTFIDPTETRGWRRAMRRNTRVLFLESPVNPSTRVIDLKPVRTLAQEQGVALVVDSTFATPINCRPIEHGADVVIHSATKFLNGHHDVLAGVVCGADSLIEEVRAKMSIWGPAPDPFAMWLNAVSNARVRVQRKHQRDDNRRVGLDASSRLAVHYPGCVASRS
jgi:cystathionine beta-lyase/cystathionine gamma-synthase